jgi:hypothetical protein
LLHLRDPLLHFFHPRRFKHIFHTESSPLPRSSQPSDK